MGMGWLNRRSSEPRPRKPRPPPFEIALIGGSEPASEEKWRTLVGPVSKLYTKNRWRLLYCGMGTGLAGSIARSVISSRGKVRGVVVEGFEPPDAPKMAQLVVTNFHERRQVLMDKPQGFLVVPGGVGTIAELADLVAWRSAGLLKKPVVLFDPNGWFAPLTTLYARAKVAHVSPVRLGDVVHVARSAGEIARVFKREISAE